MVLPAVQNSKIAPVLLGEDELGSKYTCDER